VPGDPRACREHARRYAELATLAATPEAREHFLSLEKTWIRLAAELESAEAFVSATDEIDPKHQPYSPEAA
jgi:hypothetical protein